MRKPVSDKQKKGLKPPFEKDNNAAEKPFNKVLFEDLCKIQCTEQEIISILGYKTHDTLNAKIRANYDGMTFEEVFPMLSSEGKRSVRRAQYQSAVGYAKTDKATGKFIGFEIPPNVTAQIWFGKQYMKQRETPEDLDDKREGFEIIIGYDDEN